MKYRELKHLVDVLLTGDTATPEDDAYFLAGCRYAFEVIAMNCDVAKLSFSAEEFKALTEPREVIRVNLETGRTIVRPQVPVSPDDIIDLDEGVCFTAARLIASLISYEKGEYHRRLAMDELAMYTKGQEAMREMELNNENYRR